MSDADEVQSSDDVYPTPEPDGTVLSTVDTLDTIQILARAHRDLSAGVLTPSGQKALLRIEAIVSKLVYSLDDSEVETEEPEAA